ncbi:uncharacterized protein [Venturia canescens]|uniref:uncharacterized protein n=1 Tax=Venturia canescens TaxID=32260 RepID=UPI001C9CA080|nr:uncharacterized protein LOC122407177 [Venturia canescens]
MVQKKKAETTLSVGENLNPFYLPDFVERLFILAKEFPLWTAAIISILIPRPIPHHASSSYVEGHFGDLKTRVLKNTPPPLRADKFLKIHIRDISGQTLLFASNMIMFDRKNHALKETGKNIHELEVKTTEDATVEKEECIEQNISNRSAADLISVENWRNKASHGKKYIYNLTDDSFTDICEPILSSSHNVNNSDLPVASSILASNTLNNSIDHDYCKQDSITVVQDKKGIKKVQSHLSEKVENSMASPILASNMLNTSIDHDYCKQDSIRVILEGEGIKEVQFLPSETVKNSIAGRSSPLPETFFNTKTVTDVCTFPTEEIVHGYHGKNEIKKKKSKYYEPYPDIRQRNILTASTSKPVLLPNGSICDQPIKVDGLKVFVKATCPFDSLVHILMTAALDSSEYASILEKSNNKTLRFVHEQWSHKRGLTSKSRTSKTFRIHLFTRTMYIGKSFLIFLGCLGQHCKCCKEDSRIISKCIRH